MKMRFLGMLIAATLLSGCTSWTPEQHMQREAAVMAQLQYAPVFMVKGTTNAPASVNITASNFTEFAFYQRVPQIAPVETTAQTAIKTAGSVGSALVNQTPAVIGGVVAGLAIKNPPEQNTSVSDYRSEKSVTDTSSSQISSSTTSTQN